MPFDEHAEKRGGGGGGGDCRDKLPLERREKLADDVIDVLLALCVKMANEYKLCPACSLDTVVQTMLHITRKEGDLQAEEAIGVTIYAFNEVFKQHGYRVLSFVAEQTDKSNHH